MKDESFTELPLGVWYSFTGARHKELGVFFIFYMRWKKTKPSGVRNTFK